MRGKIKLPSKNTYLEFQRKTTTDRSKTRVWKKRTKIKGQQQKSKRTVW